MNGDIRVSQGRISTLTLTRATPDGTLELSIRVSAPDGPNTEVKFDRVSALRFRGDTTELTEVVLMLAQDISDRQWFGVRFAVRDAEEEVLSFLCSAYSVVDLP
jgi:hypothetical protein